MREDFDACLKLFLKTEGGYVNNPNDHGGPTCKGVTLATARECISPQFSISALKALSDEQAGIVYKKNYWDRVGGDTLAPGVDYTAGDYAINSGPVRVIKVLQALCGVEQDGRMGPKTLAAIATFDDADIINGVNAERLQFMKSLTSSWQHFGAGWTNRVNGVRTHSLAMAKAKAAVPVSLYADQYLQQATDLPTGKAIPAPVAGKQAGVTAGGGAAAIAAFSAAHHVGGYVAMGLAFAAVGGTACAIVALQSRLNAAAETPVNVVPLKAKAA